MRTIYLIRHGMPVQVGEKRYIGITDVPLSEVGIEQMERIGNYLETREIAQIYCSPLSRCQVGAKLISKGQIPITVYDDLHEINMGDWEDIPFSVIKNDYPQLYQQRGEEMASFIPPNGESFLQCFERSKKAWEEILFQSQGNIAIVSHAGVNRTLLCWIENRLIKDLFQIQQPYGCINLVEEIEETFIVRYRGLVLE